MSDEASAGESPVPGAASNETRGRVDELEPYRNKLIKMEQSCARLLGRLIVSVALKAIDAVACRFTGGLTCCSLETKRTKIRREAKGK